MKKANIKNGILLFVAASIWGMAFVAQRVAADYIGPFTFNAVRCLLGGLVLIPVYAAFQMREADEARESEISGALAIPSEPNGKQTDTGSTQTHQNGKRTHLPKLPLKGGLVCGLFLFAGSMLQQYGIAYTTVGKAGFITAFYIVLVPIVGLFFHKRVRLLIWCSVLLALAGLYLLCINEGFSVNRGDFFLLLGALAFTGHILSIDYFVQKSDGVLLSMTQFFVCGILCSFFMFLIEKPELQQLLLAKVPLLYAGILSCGVAYTLQVVGQKGMNPTVASLILSLESVVSALSGWVILGQSLSRKELAGCVLMFIAILLTCLPDRSQAKRRW